MSNNNGQDEPKEQPDEWKRFMQMKLEELKSTSTKHVIDRKNETLEILMLALEVEHSHCQFIYSLYDQEDVKIFRDAQDKYFYRSSSRIPSNLLMLHVVLYESDETPKVRGKVKHYDENNLKVYFVTRDYVDLSKVYSVIYEGSRNIIDACLTALESIRKFGLENFFKTFDASGVEVKPKRNLKEPTEWFNRSIAGDVLQKETVKNILTESAYPLPFVVAGGAGTGKTSVIVETIAQIIENSSKARVLVTCQSNSACDEVGIRLLNFLSSDKVFRYYPYSYYISRNSGSEKTRTPNKDNYFQKLSVNSTIRPQNGLMRNVATFNDVSIDDLQSMRIMIATLTSFNYIMNRNPLKGYFDFIFIDECCAATEPECLIPIVGLAITQMKVHSNIVLVGDTNLLGPVVQSPLAKRLGLEQSLLERITKMSLYDPENPDNKKRVVKFTNNYRSHPEIFKYSNETFYNNSMEPMISVAEHYFAKDWKQLPNPGIPVIFHTTQLESAEKCTGADVFNCDEVDLVFDYVKNLMEIGLAPNKKATQEQIGIASPYLGQIKKLKARLEKYPRIDIGTTEFFQGREKPIMIISAVNTTHRNVKNEFLINPRRLNVMLTRAKSLLIIVGNLQKLYRFPFWKPFIEFCVKNELARKGPLSDQPDEHGALMEKVSMPITLDEFSESSESEEDSSEAEESSSD